MYEQLEKSKENKSRATANSVVQRQSSSNSTFQFVDNRKEGREDKVVLTQLMTKPLPLFPPDKWIIQKQGGDNNTNPKKSMKQPTGLTQEKVTFAYDASVIANNVTNMMKHSPLQLFGAKYTSLLAGNTKLIIALQDYKKHKYLNPFDVFSSLAYVTESVGETLMIPHVFYRMPSPAWFLRVSPIAGALADASQAAKYCKKKDFWKTASYSAYTMGNISMLFKNINPRLKIAMFATGILLDISKKMIHSAPKEKKT